jgi:hypothetical protein
MLTNDNRTGYVAKLKSNGATFAICEVTDTHVTIQGWVHRDTLTLRDFAARYELKKVSDV